MKEKTKQLRGIFDDTDLKKGCGITIGIWSHSRNYAVKEEDLDNDFCGEICRNKENEGFYKKIVYCELCESRLKENQRCKAEVEKVINEEIEKEEGCMHNDKYDEQVIEHQNQIEMAEKIKKRLGIK